MRKILHTVILMSLLASTTVLAETLPPGILKLKPYPAPSLSLQDIDGEPIDTTSLTGKWRFIHFWASWCGPCRREMPAIQAMQRNLLHDDIRLVIINTAESEDTVFSFLSVYAPDIHPFMDSDGQVTEAWQPRGLPATYLVDPEGQVRFQALGGRDWHTKPYLDFIRQLIRNTR